VPYIEKPRDVERIYNAMFFTYAAVGDAIDIVDLISMEVLRVFDNRLWRWIRDHIAFLFEEGRYQWRFETDDMKKDFENATSNFEGLTEQQEIILATLFPRLNEIIKQNQYPTSEPYYKTRNRAGVAIENVYDLYFAQQVPDDEVTKPEIDHILSSDRTKDELVIELRRTIKRTDSQGVSKISDLLEAIQSRFYQTTSSVPAQSLLDALWEVGDEIVSIDEPRRFLILGPGNMYRVTLTELLGALGSEEAGKYLSEKVAVESDLSINCYILHWVGLKIGTIPSDDVSRTSLIENDKWFALVEDIKPGLKRAFENGSIGTFSNVIAAEILAGQIWGDVQANALFAAAYEKAPEYLVKTIKSHLSRTSSSGDVMTEYKFSPTDRKKLFDYPLLAKHAAKIVNDLDDPESKIALKTFIDGVNLNVRSKDSAPQCGL